jgi:hypothetical protein
VSLLTPVVELKLNHLQVQLLERALSLLVLLGLQATNEDKMKMKMKVKVKMKMKCELRESQISKGWCIR